MSKDMLGVAVRKLVTLPGSTLGLVCDLLEKLSDEEWVVPTKKFLRKENPWEEVISASHFPVWKMIKLGTGLKTGQDFVSALTEQGFRVGDWAKDILGKSAFTVATQETEVDLVVVSVRDLGLRDGVTIREVYERAQELGLALCPAEVGPQLRLQYPDQPAGECLPIAMEPITDSDGDPDVFCVERDGDDQWLNAVYGNPDDDGSADDRCVFCRPKSVAIP